MKNFKDLTYVALMYIEHPVHQSSRPIIYFVNNFKISLESKNTRFVTTNYTPYTLKSTYTQNDIQNE